MANESDEFSKIGFVRTFVVPAIWLFAIPAFSWWFFAHVQSHYDRTVSEAFVDSVRADPSFPAEERERAIEFFRQVKMSKVMASGDPEMASLQKGLSRQLQTYYLTFHWMIRLSAFSILSGIGVFVIGLVSVALSLKSQQAQFRSLSAGWHLLRIYGTLQVLIQGVLLVALSFWITAFWFEFYSFRIIVVAAALALIADVAVIKAIFSRTPVDNSIQGVVIDQSRSAPLWDRLKYLCSKVGTEPPTQIIAGIDDNFFVTEQAMDVVGWKEGQPPIPVTGRTLYVSLSLLKRMNGSEADAVMLHEMAHFSGQDTVFSKKISPLLMRYHQYLQGLHEGFLSRPVFYYMLCFWGLFHISINRLSRQREFRADGIAAENTTPQDVANALIKVVGYSTYRAEIEAELFNAEEALEQANISQRIADGFPTYVDTFLAKQDIAKMETSHPFDSHPPLGQRMARVNIALEPDQIRSHLKQPADALWYQHIDEADELEKSQWDAYEEGFRQYHEHVLAYRYLPETEEEAELVQRFFPEVVIEGKKGETMTFSSECLMNSKWPDPIQYGEIEQCAMNDSTVLTIQFKREGKKTRKVKLGAFPSDGSLLQALNHYYGRYVTAVEYQKQKNEHDA